ncbi:MAG: hypothetical protein HYX93_04445 [Chloroflexi bacterium]|nr:hypothetical protein [Chloroflexota bacterium]
MQVAGAFGNLKGLLFFRDRRIASVVGIGLIVGSLAWFFRDGGRNIPDTNGGIPGASQFGFFVLGGFMALLFTFAATSLTNFRKSSPTEDTVNGLPALRETTFLQAVLSNLGMLWRVWRRVTKRYSSG